MAKIPVIYKKRIIAAFGIFSILLTVLCFRVGYMQVVKGEEYSKKAMTQQKKDEVVEAKRGAILDRNGTELAVSTVKYSVWVRPAALKVKDNEEKSKENLDKTVQALAEILEKEPAEIEEKLTQDISLVKVDKYLERSTADAIRKWVAEEKISGISITQETKREYPMNEFAAHLLGSVTDDNNGLSGLEQYYNKYLRGVSGRWIQSKDANGRSLSYGDEEYYAAEDGSNIVLTIDSVIQNYAEKAIASAKSQYKADRVSCIAMDPKTGEVLAMASNPGFNPNTSRVPTDPAEAEALAALPEEEQLDYLNKMWRNPLVSDTYVPGSTMKLITTAMALEEDVTNLNEGFYDTGSINVSGVQLKCWSYAQPHGSETLKEAVGNSCNPVFVQLAQRLGIEKFYDYLGLFGITEKTGIDYPGEGVSQLQNVDTAGPVGLATMGYGQGIAVTPIELITAISAFGNEGMLMQPHLVKEIQNSKGETVKKIQPTKVKQAVSQATAAQICDTMEFVVTNGGSGNAKIDGYRVGGKTGTANTEADNNKITASFVGMAPMEDPQIVVLFIVVNPEGAIYGSTVAAPGGKEVIENSLRRLKIKPSSEVTQSGKNKTVTVPAVAGKSLGEAKAILEGSGLTYKVSPAQEEEVEFTVVDQYPKSGEGIEAGGTVYLYRE